MPRGRHGVKCGKSICIAGIRCARAHSRAPPLTTIRSRPRRASHRGPFEIHFNADDARGFNPRGTRTREHAARLGGHRLRARLPRTAVRGRELWRQDAALRPRRPLAPSDLSAVARDLLHVLDLLRLGRPRHPHRVRVSDDLSRPHSDDRPVLAAHHTDRPPRQGAEHHLDRRLHRRPLRQGADGGRGRRADRHRRHHSVHRAAAQGGVLFTHHHPGAYRAGERRDAAGAGRHRLLRRGRDGTVRGAVRHPAHRRHRASGRTDAGDRDRVARQAGGVRRGRHFRDLLAVRRAVLAVCPRARTSRYRGGADARALAGHADRDDDAVAVRHRAAAAAVSRHRGGEQQRGRDQTGGLAVPALPGADQPVRGADRARRHADLHQRAIRQRHVRARAAAGGAATTC